MIVHKDVDHGKKYLVGTLHVGIRYTILQRGTRAEPGEREDRRSKKYTIEVNSLNIIKLSLVTI